MKKIKSGVYFVKREDLEDFLDSVEYSGGFLIRPRKEFLAEMFSNSRNENEFVLNFSESIRTSYWSCADFSHYEDWSEWSWSDDVKYKEFYSREYEGPQKEAFLKLMKNNPNSIFAKDKIEEIVSEYIVGDDFKSTTYAVATVNIRNATTSEEISTVLNQLISGGV